MFAKIHVQQRHPTMNTEELTPIVTAHQNAITRHDVEMAEIRALLAESIRANEAARKRFDAETVNLANLISAQAESVQRAEESVQRLADILSERFRSNGH